MHRTSSRQGLSISREADSTTFLGSLVQCSATLRVKKFFLMFMSFLCLSLCPLPLVLSLGTTEKSLAPSQEPQGGFRSIGALKQQCKALANLAAWSTVTFSSNLASVLQTPPQPPFTHFPSQRNLGPSSEGWWGRLPSSLSPHHWS